MMMENDEIKRKDWQLLTADLLIVNHSMLKQILKNQAVIMAELTQKTTAEVELKMSDDLEECYQGTIESVRKNVPDYPKEETPYKKDILK